jgi:hypothetical protein
MKKILNWAVTWFESGDLVPLLVLVSAVHYAAVLASKDAWVVAVAIGLLVDLGHYRTVRAAVRYSGADGWQRVARWTIAIAMTALSLNYHERYYQDWWLSAPLPLLIAALAWLQQIERKPVSKAEREQSKAEADSKIVLLPSERKLLESKTAANESGIESGFVCSCGFVAKSQAALNGHQRAHRKVEAKVS